MNPYELPLALLTFVGFAAVLPGWLFFIGQYAPDLSPPAQFLATFALPAIMMLFLAGWIGG